MPHDLPPWGMVWRYFRNWRDDGTWEAVEETLRARVRKARDGRLPPARPSLTANRRRPQKKGPQRLRRGQEGNRTQGTHRGGHREFAAGRGGSRRQHSGSGRPKLVLAKLLGNFPRLQLIRADVGYAGQRVAWVWAAGGWLLTVVKPSPTATASKSCPDYGQWNGP